MRQIRAMSAHLRTSLRSNPLRHARTLLLGKGVQGLCSTIYLVLAARVLGPTDFGTLVLIHAFTMGIAQLVNFQSWQAIVRYGALALEGGDRPRMQRLLHFSVLVDLIGALVAVLLITCAMPLAGKLFELPPAVMPMAQIYGLAVIPLIFSSTSLGILRLCQRFDRIALLTALSPLVRLGGTVALVMTGGDLTAFLWVWLGSTVINRVGQTWFAWQELRKQDVRFGRPDLRSTVRGPEPGIWRFIFGTNLGSSLDLASAQLGTMAVGYMLGPAGAGLYRVAQQVSNVLIKPNTRLLIPALYPEMAKLTARGETEARNHMVIGLIGLIGIAAITVFVCLELFGEWLIGFFFGSAFLPAYHPMLWLAAAGLIGALCFPLEPMMIAAGRIRRTVSARLFATAAYALGLWYLLPTHGLVGAGMASTLYAGVTGLLFYVGARSELRKKGVQHDAA